MTHIIGLSGLAGSGKSTAARILENRGYHVIGFADALKDMVRELYDVDRTVLQGETPMTRDCRDRAEYGYGGFTPRELLQKTGVAMRDVHPDTWVVAAWLRVQGFDKVAVPDVRFLNEARAVRDDWAGWVLHVERGARPGWVNWIRDRGFLSDADARQVAMVAAEEGVDLPHESEWRMYCLDFQTKVKARISNDGTIRDLELQLERFAQ